MGFKATVDPSLVYFVTCVQRIFQIHLWCDIYWPLDGQYDSRSRSRRATDQFTILFQTVAIQAAPITYPSYIIFSNHPGIR